MHCTTCTNMSLVWVNELNCTGRDRYTIGYKVSDLNLNSLLSLSVQFWPRRHQLSIQSQFPTQLRKFSNHRWVYTQLSKLSLFHTLLSMYSTPFFPMIQTVSWNVQSRQNEMYTSGPAATKYSWVQNSASTLRKYSNLQSQPQVTATKYLSHFTQMLVNL